MTHNNTFNFGRTMVLGVAFAITVTILVDRFIPPLQPDLARLPDYDTLGQVSPERCPFGQTPHTKCLRLTVPQDHAAPEGPVISIYAVILSPAAGTTKPDPFLYLEGGPGYAAIQLNRTDYDPYGDLRIMFRDILATGRDVIFVDTRGLGLATPALDCPYAAQILYDQLKLKPHHRNPLADFENIRDCLNELRNRGIDISQYQSDAVARDLKMLREALNIPEWNVYGISYGARTALSVLDVDQAGVRKVIFDSPSYGRLDAMPADQIAFDRILNELDMLCAAQDDGTVIEPLCDGGKIIERFDALMAALSSNPLPVRSSPVTRPFWIDNYNAISLFHDELYLPDGYRTFLEMLSAMETQGRDYFSTLNNWGQYWFDSLNWHYLDEAYSMAIYFSTACSEMDFNASVPVSKHALFSQEDVELQQRLCTETGLTFDDREIRATAFTDTPALVFSGHWDVITPPAYGQALAKDIEGIYAHHPTESHGILFWSDDDCVRKISTDFLEAVTLIKAQNCPVSLQLAPPFSDTASIRD